MKKNRKKKSDSKQLSKQLASYATAASLGAFSLSDRAEAAINYTDFPDTALSSLPQVTEYGPGDPNDPLTNHDDFNHTLPIDLNGDSTDDMYLFLSFRRLIAGHPYHYGNTGDGTDKSGGDIAMKFAGFSLATPGNSVFLDKGGDTYYFLRNAFKQGDTIGVGGPDNVVAQDLPPFSNEGQALLVYDYSLYGNSRAPKYVVHAFGTGDGTQATYSNGFVGFKWDMTGAGTDFHYGWLEIETVETYSPNGFYYGVEYADAIVKGFAYETTPNTPIVAGDTGAQPGDFNGDGIFDGRDFLEWQLGQSPNPLTASDLADWESNYGFAPPLTATTAVPEPNSLGLLAAGAGAMTFFRRRKTK